jgi:competence protein ComEA
MRWNPEPRIVVAGVLVALLALTATGVWVWSGRPNRGAPVSAASAESSVPSSGSHGEPQLGGSLKSPIPSGSSAVPSSPASGAAATASGELIVDVVGKVKRPGIYRLPAGARVNDAVAAAGGSTCGSELRTVNLARKVSDGEQVAICVTGAGSDSQPSGPGNGGSGASSPSSGSASGLVELNTATADRLQTLPGVGPVLAGRILQWRTEHGQFHSVDDLNSVPGIGAATFARLRPLVTVR